MAELGKQGSISIWVGLSLCRIGRKTIQVWRLGHALDENEYMHPNIVVPKLAFLASSCRVNLLARALARDMMRVDSKVPLGIAPPPIT